MNRHFSCMNEHPKSQKPCIVDLIVSNRCHNLVMDIRNTHSKQFNVVYLVGIILCVIMASTTAEAQESHFKYYLESVNARQEGDLEGFLVAARQADTLRPNHPRYTYLLAAALMSNGQISASLEVLNQRLDYFAGDEFVSDSLFIDARKDPAFTYLEAKLAVSHETLKTSELFFQVDDPTIHAEGITYSNVLDSYLLSDVYTGHINSCDSETQQCIPIIDLKDDGYWSALGIAVDPTNPSILWVATTATTTFQDYDESIAGRSAILKYDLNTSELVQAFESDALSNVGDLTISNNGDVYFTDGSLNRVFIIRSGSNTIETAWESPSWWNLQGLAFNESESVLYVADYITGIYRIDINNNEIVPIMPQNWKTKGTDGLYRINNRLILIQNGTYPKRLASVELDANGEAIPASYTILDQNRQELIEPTLGVVVHNNLIYIANSAWGLYLTDGSPDLAARKPLYIFRLPE